MQTTFADVWKSAEYFISQGLCLIPLHDKDTIYKGRTYTKKSAYPWKKYQTEMMQKDELYHLMYEKWDTTAFGIVTGKISDNLEVIDVDVKNWPGIDAMLFTTIEKMFPQLYDKLFIRKTPSGGFHLLYRITGGNPEKNLKLAYKEESKEAALETRGEGGYIAASPSLGYSDHQLRAIPIITWEERCSLIKICRSFNEKPEKKNIEFKPSEKSDYYSLNPFDDYNHKDDGKVLYDNGWKICGKSNNFIYYTRPGKDSGVSASFNKSTLIYYIFTSSTNFENARGYQPATILAHYMFGGDKKKTFQYLVQSGFGKINEKFEKKVISNTIKQKAKLPANISNEAKVEYEKLKLEMEELLPYGEFWFYNSKNELNISRENFVNVADNLGFRNYRNEVVKVVNNFIHNVTLRQFQDDVKAYIKIPDALEYEQVCNCYEKFMESHGKYTMQRLPLLDEDLIVKDTKNAAYKFFENGIQFISVDGFKMYPYEKMNDRLVWANKIQKRKFNDFEGGKYYEFIKLAVGSDMLSHVQKCLGFLTHEYKDETTGYIIVLTEQCPDPKQGGGSGKNVFCNLLKLSTTYTNKPGAQAKFDEKFFQSWNGQRIFGISDVSKDFDFSFLKEPSTGSFIWKRLFKDEVEIPNSEAPKFIVQTNFSYDITDGGLKRRIVPIEFTDFFTRCGGLDVHFGCHFPDGWSEEDFNGYDTFIAYSIQEWLKAGRKLTSPILTSGGWEKQFRQKYGEMLFGFITEYWNLWLERQTVPNSEFNQDLERYAVENNINKIYYPSSIKINAALKEWAEKRNYSILSDKIERTLQGVQKCRKFLEIAPF